MSSSENKAGFFSGDGSIFTVPSGADEHLRPYTAEEITILDMSMLEGMRKNGILGDDTILDVAERMPYSLSEDVRKLRDIQPEKFDNDH